MKSTNHTPVFSAVLIWLCFSQALAFEDNGAIESFTETLEEAESLQGIVFDRTITQTGFNFYQEFTHLWLTDPASRQHSLTIRETPTARQGSIIWIEESSRLLHRLNIGLRNKEITAKAESSLEATRMKLGENTFTINGL